MRRAKTLYELKRDLIGDSRGRENDLKHLIQLIREDERAKVLDVMAGAKAKAEQEGAER